jgi:hypothetical protein
MADIPMQDALNGADVVGQDSKIIEAAQALSGAMEVRPSAVSAGPLHLVRFRLERTSGEAN